MDDLLMNLPGWLLLVLGGGYVVRVELKNKNNGNGSDLLAEILKEARELRRHVETWCAVNEDRIKRIDVNLSEHVRRTGDGKDH